MQLIAIDPAEISISGGVTSLSFTGTLPPGVVIRVNEYSRVIANPPTSPIELQVPPGSGSISIALEASEGSMPFAALGCAGRYVSVPAHVTLALDTRPYKNSLIVPLHPELARPCARRDTVLVTNDGDEPTSAQPTVIGSSSLSVAATMSPESPCGPSLRRDICSIEVCFTSSVAGTFDAQLQLVSATNVAQLDVSATALPAATDLDTTFAGDGAMLRAYITTFDEYPAGLTPGPSGSVIAWDTAPSTSFFMFTPGGAMTSHAQGAVALLPGNGFLTRLRAGGSGLGIYAIASYGALDGQQNALIHFDDAGTRDPAFAAGAGAVSLDADHYYYPTRGRIEIQAAGRILVIGAASVRAFTPGGAVDTSYGSAGIASFSTLGAFTGFTALDSSDRLYLTTAQGVLRLLANGTIDATFSYGIPVEAMTLVADLPLVVAAGVVSRVGATGTSTAITLDAVSQLSQPMIDLDVDANGSLYLLTASGDLAEFSSAGTFLGLRGFDHAFETLCPTSGGCWVSGVTGATPQVAPAWLDKYLLRLAP